MDTATTTLRPSLDNPESNINIDKAAKIVDKLQTAKLYTSSLQSNFDQKVIELHEGDATSDPSSSQRHPADIAADVASQVAFLRTLKFQYLEQNAKDKYIKTIVDDEAPLITLDDNEALRESNDQRKAQLKAAKEKLAAKYADIKTIASEVEEKHRLAQQLTTSLTTLTSQILDARLALSRLRTAHPPSARLSIPRAENTLESQTEQMTSLDAALSETNASLEETKVRLQERARAVERVKVERAAVEAEVREVAGRGEEGDERVVGLYDWYSASIALHQSLFSLQTKHAVSENELQLTYQFDPPEHMHSSPPVQFTLTLLFHPNTRHLADASVSSLHPKVANLDLQDLVGSHVQCNDVAGLVRGVHARVREVLGYQVVV